MLWAKLTVQSVRFVNATSLAAPSSPAGIGSDPMNKCSPDRSSNIINRLWSIVEVGLGEDARFGVDEAEDEGEGVAPAAFLDLNENFAFGTSLVLN